MRSFVLLCCLAATLFITGCCDPPDSHTLPVTLRPQETSMWCWAASGEMSMDFLGTDVSQCDEANKQFNRTDCCNNPVPSACVKGGWPEFPKYGFTSDHTTDAPLTWAQIREQIYCRKTPFAMTWHWSGGGGHMMLVRGYKTEGGINYVYRYNPLPVNTGTSDILTYDAYVTGSTYTHWDDYYNIAKQ